jgi:glycosyltransferase involved in cell wall biosynthesis
MLLEAWRMGEFDGATLAVVGSSGQLFQKCQFDFLPNGVRLLGSVEDALLPVLYCGATGFIYPSVYEGFGLPPLEAMACGCPVAVSDIPAHREVCGSVAMYFDPYRPEDLSAKLEGLLRLDDAARESLVEQGLKRAALHRWEDAAAETWRILQVAMNG